MGTDKVVEEDEHGNEVVGGSKRRKALLGFVPCLELLVKALNEVVGGLMYIAFPLLIIGGVIAVYVKKRGSGP